MHHCTLVLGLLISGIAGAATGASDAPASEVSLTATADARKVTLLGGLALDATLRPSAAPALRLTDGLRFEREGLRELDAGGALSGETRQILALILGFVPGFGIGHLIARDRDGFILFLIIDVALYVLWGVGWRFFSPFAFIGGAVWLVVHIIQALDAYAEAGGERIVGVIREKAMVLADLGPGRESARPTVRAFEFRF